MGAPAKSAALAALLALAWGALAQDARPAPRPAGLGAPDLPDTRPPPRPEGWARLTRPRAPDWAVALACEGRGAPAACRALLAGTDPASVGYPVARLCAVMRPGAPAREAPCIGQEGVTPDGIEMRWRLSGGGTVLVGSGGEVDAAPARRISDRCRRAEDGTAFCVFPAPR